MELLFTSMDLTPENFRGPISRNLFTTIWVVFWSRKKYDPRLTHIPPKRWTPHLPSLKLTASLHLKMDGWNRIVSFWGPAYFQGQLLV